MGVDAISQPGGAPLPCVHTEGGPPTNIGDLHTGHRTIAKTVRTAPALSSGGGRAAQSTSRAAWAPASSRRSSSASGVAVGVGDSVVLVGGGWVLEWLLAATMLF